MSPAHTQRHLLVWSLPTIAVLLSFLWYKRRKNSIRADSGGIDPGTSTRLSEPAPEQDAKVTSSKSTTPSKPVPYSRSLSGIESTPIDIKTPRSVPLVISDTELDLEIEKIRSMKTSGSVKKQMAASPVKRRPSKKAQSTNSSVDNTITDDELQDCGNSVDRDSANHSPVEALMPGSPSLSSISDTQSDSDSGKGGSDVVTPPPVQQANPQSEASSLPDASASDIEDVIVFDFVIPQGLVGRLIGRRGAFVHTIREKTNARILIKRHPDTDSKIKVCSVEGTHSEIDAALSVIRDKFPLKRFPELTLEKISFVPVVPDCMHLRLIEGVNNDTIVSCLNSAGHLFLQQPTHPTFPSLNVLTHYMLACYNDVSCQSQPPLLPLPIHPGTICAAESEGSWYRATVLSFDEDAGSALIRFLDYGGFTDVPHTQLRQIRGDFILLPFQAAECMLANVEPIGEDGETSHGWNQEAFDLVQELTNGVLLFTQIVDYFEEEGVIPIPLVHIYVRSSAESRGVVLLNRVLVDRGVARWVEQDAR